MILRLLLAMLTLPVALRESPQSLPQPLYTLRRPSYSFASQARCSGFLRRPPAMADGWTRGARRNPLPRNYAPRASETPTRRGERISRGKSLM